MMETWTRSVTEMMKAANSMAPAEDVANPFNMWRTIYETQFQKYFQVPQLGLTREYQERVIRMLDQFNLFQTSFTEFIGQLNQPFQASLESMQEKLAEMAEAGEMPDDPDAYYRIWIKLLEEQFTFLFQTPEYAKTLSGTMAALSSFSKAKDAVLEDLIKDLPVAPRSELDELAKEVYKLKKRIRRLEAAQEDDTEEYVTIPQEE